MQPAETDPYAATLCSTAFAMVDQSNRKRCNILDIDNRLSRGCHSSDVSLEGCQVDNAILSSVLADIS